jgi:hypothetical protein
LAGTICQQVFARHFFQDKSVQESDPDEHVTTRLHMDRGDIEGLSQTPLHGASATIV